MPLIISRIQKRYNYLKKGILNKAKINNNDHWKSVPISVFTFQSKKRKKFKDSKQVHTTKQIIKCVCRKINGNNTLFCFGNFLQILLIFLLPYTYEWQWIKTEVSVCKRREETNIKDDEHVKCNTWGEFSRLLLIIFCLIKVCRILWGNFGSKRL